jgi:hypothetical protein
LFSEKNVTVSEGKLHLTMRKEKVPEKFEKLGYKDYMRRPGLRDRNNLLESWLICPKGPRPVSRFLPRFVRFHLEPRPVFLFWRETRA